ncbi:hypothetical protein SMICM17S_05169 [Streptomyces microflavus]
MSAEDLEKYETEMELKLYREYRDVVGLFKYVIETERRFYLTNDYEMQVHSVQGEVFFEVSMADAWVWDMYRPARFVKQVRVHVQGREHRGAEQERPGAAGRVTEFSTTAELLTEIDFLCCGCVIVGAGGGADMNARGATAAGTARRWPPGGWPGPG